MWRGECYDLGSGNPLVSLASDVLEGLAGSRAVEVFRGEETGVKV